MHSLDNALQVTRQWVTLSYAKTTKVKLWSLKPKLILNGKNLVLDRVQNKL